MNPGAARGTMCTDHVLLIPLVAFGTHSEGLTTTQLNSLVKPSFRVISQDGKREELGRKRTMHLGAMSQPRERRVKSITKGAQEVLLLERSSIRNANGNNPGTVHGGRQKILAITSIQEESRSREDATIWRTRYVKRGQIVVPLEHVLRSDPAPVYTGQLSRKSRGEQKGDGGYKTDKEAHRMDNRATVARRQDHIPFDHHRVLECGPGMWP
ncbi:hypothetical protein EDB89DRAFT_1901475 [Lactarius sanguifluus]|nr:hypothetical protein EDB89DRAFT_1901475 [Lactarius sanguifluus]